MSLLPPFFVKGEFAFMVHLLAKATGREIKPSKVITTFDETAPEMQEYFTIVFSRGSRNSISFRKADLQLPFISENHSLLEYLEPELKKRLAELDVDDSASQRVRNALVELLPRGAATIDDVAPALGVSKRTLQRKLKAEETNFQQQLNATREMLAKNYTEYNDVNWRHRLSPRLLGNELLPPGFYAWTSENVQQYRQLYIPQA